MLFVLDDVLARFHTVQGLYLVNGALLQFSIFLILGLMNGLDCKLTWFFGVDGSEDFGEGALANLFY